MRILHVINNLGPGGAEKILTELLPGMRRENHEVFVLIANDKNSVKSYHEELIASGVDIINMNIGFYNPLQIFVLFWKIIRIKPQIVHAHLFPTQYWVAVIRIFVSRKIKFVKTEHSVFNERKQIKLLRPVEKLIYNQYAGLIAISTLVRDNLADWLKTDRIKIISNGLNVDRVQNSVALDEIVSSFKTPGIFKILMVGRFDGVAKDQETLIKAMVDLPPSVHLFFAGVGPEMDNEIALVNSLELSDRVHFLGYRKDVFSLMNLTDLNVLSTRFEGLSGVTLESLASRRPFIGSDVVGVQDVVPSKDYLFEQGDSAMLRDKILKLKEDPDKRKAMVEEANLFVMDYKMDKMVANYLAFYAELIGERL